MDSRTEGISRHPIFRRHGVQSEKVNDCLAIEEPLEIRLQYTDTEKGRLHRSISITMRTPGQDALLALGFLFSENIVTEPASIETVEQVNENVVRVVVAEHIRLDLSRLERHFYTTSSCGICGKASLEALSMQGASVQLDNDFQIDEQTLMALPERLRSHQPLFDRSGGNHGVGLFDAQGRILRCHEDIGRHNAMDKLIGACFQAELLPLHDFGIIVSGRASFELMQKALMAGARMLVAVGAPSSLAVELAEEFNMSLAGFVSKRGYNLYHNEQAVLRT